MGRALEPEDKGGRYSALWDLARSNMFNSDCPHSSTRPEIKKMFGYSTHDWLADTSDRCNEESIVLEITIENHKVLLTGDIEEDAERHLLDKISDVDVKVAHHGSRSSTSKDLITLLKQVECYICGEYSRFGHPHPETLWSLRNSTY